jgi:hypothetical protein
MPIMLTPENDRDLKTFRSMMEQSKVRKREITDLDKEGDHPNVTEMRDRLVDVVKELDEMGML